MKIWYLIYFLWFLISAIIVLAVLSEPESIGGAINALLLWFGGSFVFFGHKITRKLKSKLNQ